MKTFLATLLFLVSTFYANAQLDEFYKGVDHIMHKYVKHGMVNYSALKSDPSELNKIVEQIKNVDLKTLSDDEFIAFIINAYNMLVIDNVVNNYPTQGPLKVKGFFTDKSFVIGTIVLSLDDLEKKILFGKTKDSRLHFVLSCAAVGCPPLTNTVYRPNTVYDQLKEQTRLSINDEIFTKIDRKKKEVQLSQIFDWYALHFGSSKKEQIAYLNKYLKEPITNDYKIKYYTYNWDLNDWKQ